MNKEKFKKNIVPFLLLLALLFLCVGITYTALTYMKSSEDNTVKTGKISMSYSEPSNALELVNALPMSDEEGLNQTNFFEFTVTSNATTNVSDDIGVTIPYEINISDIAIDTDKTVLPKDKIKVAVTKVVDGKEETIMMPTVISKMGTSVLREDASKVYETKDVYKNNNGAITTRYRLRAWIDKGFELDNTKTYQYKFRVNVNGQVGVLEKQFTLNELILGKNNANVVTSGDGLYSTTDTNGGKPSYYYKGAVENNYVSLPEKNGEATTNALYRIVRINEDGSIRLIRQEGINNNATYRFSKSRSHYNHMYYSNNNVENGIMKTVNDWYTSAIEGTTINGKVVESSFCEQAKCTWASNTTLTAGSQEMAPVTNDYVPSLKCETDANGKGLLNMKVGLLMADEAIMAGYPFYTKTQINNTSIYLHNNNSWWTMTPAGYNSNSNYSNAWLVVSDGFVENYNTYLKYDRVRPVFSLSSDITVSGKGTISKPYEPILIDRQF